MSDKDIELVIKVPEELYNHIMNDNVYFLEDGEKLHDIVKNGIPLPKGHGSLKDELDLDLFAPSLGTDEYVRDLMAKHNIDYANGDDEDRIKAFAMDLIKGCMNVIKTATTIIEADKVESEE